MSELSHSIVPEDIFYEQPDLTLTKVDILSSYDLYKTQSTSEKAQTIQNLTTKLNSNIDQMKKAIQRNKALLKAQKWDFIKIKKSKESINTFLTNLNQTVICKICFHRKQKMMTACGHLVCQPCLRKQFLKSNIQGEAKCPFCKDKIYLDDVHELFREIDNF